MEIAPPPDYVKMATELALRTRSGRQFGEGYEPVDVEECRLLPYYEMEDRWTCRVVYERGKDWPEWKGLRSSELISWPQHIVDLPGIIQYANDLAVVAIDRQIDKLLQRKRDLLGIPVVLCWSVIV